MDILPITLVGDNLGERHQYINKLVQETYEKNVPFESIRDLPERSAVDRLFKIELANKYKNVEFILHTLKDEDMFFVSRALKCTWLLTYTQDGQCIINPQYLETKLYPHMLTTASNKMKHWIHLHLKDENRSEEFYNYYKDTNFDLALKFLPKCSVQFFLKEMKVIPLSNITPHLLKLMCEKSATAADIYFFQLKTGGCIDEKYIQNIQFLLKTSPDIYFHVIESFFLAQFTRLNKEATEYIMRNHRHRFFAKRELYTGRILHLPTLAKYLSSEEAKQLILCLAKAKYLGNDCSFKFCEPLTKQINIHEKNDFCNKVFKQGHIGVSCYDAPYPIPPLAEKRKLIDFPEDECTYDHLLEGPKLHEPLLGGGGNFRNMFEELFNQYRFCSFEKTFSDLQKLIYKESEPHNRKFMFLVLVSKSGGRDESLGVLLRWLTEQFQNEPSTTRAAVIRSLVKRAGVWRVSDAIWSLLLEYGHDLGLDGSPTDNCREGLHGVVLRYLLQNIECPPAVWTAYIKNFSPLNEYSLSVKERKLVQTNLLSQLMYQSQFEIEAAGTYLTLAIDVLDAYGLSIKSYPAILSQFVSYISRDPIASRPIQVRLFNDRIACQRLFQYNFAICQTDESYLNALRHDAKFLRKSSEFEAFLDTNIYKLCHERFFRKLALYFSEEGGLVHYFSALLQRKAARQPHWKLSRPIAHLSRNRLPTLLEPQDEDYLWQYQKMITSLQKNAHVMRPKVSPLANITELIFYAKIFLHDNYNFYWLSVWVHTCSPVALQRSLNMLLSVGRSARMVLALRAPADRTLLSKALPPAARNRPVRALRVATRLLRNNPCEQTLDEDWVEIKIVLLETNLENKKFQLYCELAKLDAIPKKIQLDYCVTICKAFNGVGYDPDTGVPYRVALPLLAYILDHWKSVDELLLHDLLKDFLSNGLSERSFHEMHVENVYWRRKEFPDLTSMKLNSKRLKEAAYITYGAGQRNLDGDYFNYITVFLRVLVRFLYSSDSVWIQSFRILTHLMPFLMQVKNLWTFRSMRDIFDEFLKILMFNVSFINKFDCLRVLQAVKEYCEEISPLYTDSALSLRIRLTILYYKTVKKYYEMQPGIAEKDDFIPRVFGELVANDLEKMVRDHFQSLRMYYCDELECFIREYFRGHRSIIMLINGLIKDSKVDAAVVGAMLYQERITKNVLRAHPELSVLNENLLTSFKNMPVNEVRFFL